MSITLSRNEQGEVIGISYYVDMEILRLARHPTQRLERLSAEIRIRTHYYDTFELAQAGFLN